jgi:hypothetical protein
MKMKSDLKIPVFADSVVEDIAFGEPASIKDSIKRVLGNSVNFVDIDTTRRLNNVYQQQPKC